jgi:outer membrane protein assembly factor BamB
MSKIGKRVSIVVLVSLVFVELGLINPILADDWPQWLGPQRLPVWNEEDIVDEFPKQGPPLRWKAELGGGYSGPAVANGRVFVMDRLTPSDDLEGGPLLHDDQPPTNQNFVRRLLPGKERVLCFRESDGAKLWTHEYDCPYTSVAMYAIGPRCTPTVDGDRVFALGAEGHLVCLQVEDGAVVWKRNLVDDYDLKIPEWGIAAHPLVDGDRLICMVGGNGTTCVAFDKTTGKEIWRALSAKQPGYCPPMIYELGGLRQLVTWDSDAVSGLNPENGEVYWRVPFQATFAMTIGAPQREGNSLFVMAYNDKSAMIQVSDDGRSAEIAWEGGSKNGIDGVLNTAVIQDGYIYGCGNGGRYICAELKTGNRVWSSFLPSTGKRPASWANVFTVQNQDRFFLANDLGNLIIAKMSPDGYQELSRAHLIDPTHAVGSRRVVWSHPAFANRSVYLRNDKELRCYSLSKTVHENSEPK